jgi:hypothetical protein
MAAASNSTNIGMKRLTVLIDWKATDDSFITDTARPTPPTPYRGNTARQEAGIIGILAYLLDDSPSCGGVGLMEDPRLSVGD